MCRITEVTSARSNGRRSARGPDFFIVGAPKCGTTALYSYLRTHPNIFLCEPKEPNFFSTDFPAHRYVTDEKEYLHLFQGASESKTHLGEASAWYLYSQEALLNIRRFKPEAKIIVMVRNPVDMFPSLHAMLLRNFAENQRDLERAWDLQESRRDGSHLAKGRNWRFDPKTCLYSDVCKLGSQVERLLGIFPREQVIVIVFDDFVRDTRASYEAVLRFLDLPSDGRTSFPPQNIRRDFKSRHLAWVSWKLRDAGAAIKRRLGIAKVFNVIEMLHRFNEQSESRPTLSPEFRKRLIEDFRTDTERLATLIRRDLSDWWLQG